MTTRCLDECTVTHVSLVSHNALRIGIDILKYHSKIYRSKYQKILAKIPEISKLLAKITEISKLSKIYEKNFKNK